ncbi:MAG: hypothetical protein WD341_06225 [Tistlia sp.]|uniref:hypothetical protein n=1 Tax=Tistlia sp. TaxID=3057121 RepID=UPI0034A5B31D
MDRPAAPPAPVSIGNRPRVVRLALRHIRRTTYGQAEGGDRRLADRLGIAPNELARVELGAAASEATATKLRDWLAEQGVETRLDDWLQAQPVAAPASTTKEGETR